TGLNSRIEQEPRSRGGRREACGLYPYLDPCISSDSGSSDSSSSKRGGSGGRLKTCAPCGDTASKGKTDYGTADRWTLDLPRSSTSKARRAVGIGRARTPARAES